jgi:hypothetical protein
MTNRRMGTALLLATAGLGAVRCQAILTAPLGSVLRMEANPPFIEANGGVSVISVAVIEPTGTVVPDGTVVQFFTTLGRIDEQGKTNDGIARVNLVSTGLSGVANVTAVSGGEAPAVTSSTIGTPGSTTPGTTTPGTITPTTRPGPFPPGGSIQFGFAEGEGSATMTVAIGSARPTRVVLAADAARVTAQRPVRITAFVLDASTTGDPPRANPVANVPVFFRIEVPTGAERLASGGDPVFTDLNGAASDTLTTTAAATAPPRTVNIIATTANGISSNIVVPVN